MSTFVTDANITEDEWAEILRVLRVASGHVSGDSLVLSKECLCCGARLSENDPGFKDPLAHEPDCIIAKYVKEAS